MSMEKRIKKLEIDVKDIQEAVNTLIKEDDMFAMPSEEAQKRAVRKKDLDELHG